MKAIVLSVFRRTITAIQMVGLCLYLPGLAMHPAALERMTHESSCLDDLTIQVTADPSRIRLGQSSTVNWIVDIPPECGYTLVQLNGTAVAQRGSQMVMPTQNTTYSITVFLNFNDVPGEKTASTDVTVNDSEIYLWCPYIVRPESLDIAQAYSPIGTQAYEPVVPWQDESLNLPTTSFFLGPALNLDNNVTSHNNLPTAVGPRIPLLSLCAFTPLQPSIDLDHLLPQPSKPVATAPTA